MRLLRAYPLSGLVVVLSVAAVGAFFAFARPAYHPESPPAPPDHGLPYTKVSYTAAEAKRAFAAEGIALTLRSQQPGIVTTLGNEGDVLEVDAFGDANRVRRSGFSDYTSVNDRFVHFPHACRPGVVDAERWRGNVRVIVACAASPNPNAWLRRAARALGRL